MTNSPSPTSTPPDASTFDQLPVAAYVEVDRFCIGCACNLHGQAVRLDPATNVPLVRCAQCGRFHPAADAATSTRPWLRRLVTLAVFAWVLAILAFIFTIGVIQMSITVSGIDEVRRYNYYLQNVPPDALNKRAHDLRVTLTTMAAGCELLGWAAGVVWTVIFPHWRRWGYVAIAAGLPALVVAIIVAFAWLIDKRSPVDSRAVTVIFAMMYAIGGSAAAYLGRPIVRGLVRLLMPAKLRAPLSYLWLVDGKTPAASRMSNDEIRMMKE